MSLTHTVTSLGHLASRKQLRILGFGRTAVDAAIRSGWLLQIRPGWVGTLAASQPAVVAVLHGGRLTASAALQMQEVWAGTDARIHIQVPANAHRVVQPPRIPLSDFAPAPFMNDVAVHHWTSFPALPPDRPAWIVPTIEALVQFARTENDEQIVAAIESAVHARRIFTRELSELFHRLPRRLQPLRKRLAFTADSGLETIARLRLQDAGYQLNEQVQIGPDRVDLVIGGWLVVELDGDRWHDAALDRIRTNRLIRTGYTVLRFGYTDVLHCWGETLATVRAVVR